MIKSLVVFYSRTGITGIIARAIAERLGSDVEELIDQKDRKGPLGFVISGKDAALKKQADIKQPEKDPSSYDLVLLGTPVWAGSMSCAMRTYLRMQKSKLENVAFFCTTGRSAIEATFRHMQEECGKKPLAVLGLRTKQVKKEQYQEKLSEFVQKLAQSN